MQYTNLGNTGIKVSRICLGTMTFGKNQFNIGGVSQETASKMVRESIDAGINFFDTADVYSFGEAEAMLAEALKDYGRDDFVIATKVRGKFGKTINDVGLSRKHIFKSIDASLRRLKTSYVDLYQIHGWDATAPLEETMKALNDLVRQGKVLHIGFSNISAAQLANALIICEKYNLAKFVTAQMYYSLLGRDIEEEIVPLCSEYKIGILPWSPLAGGFLSGKYSDEKNPPVGTRAFDRGSWFPQVNFEKGYEIIAELRKMKEGSPAQISLAWLLSKLFVDSVIIGARKIEQLKDNISSVNTKVSKEHLELLDKITQPEKRYPHWMIELQGSRSFDSNINYKPVK